MPKKLMTLMVIVLPAMFFFAAVLHGEVAWKEGGIFATSAEPLAVAHSQDGKWLFVLTADSRVRVYDTDGVLQGLVPVSPGVKGLAVSARGDRLYLIDARRKTVRTVEVDFILPINISGSPFLGSPAAPVAVVVFSDFQ